MSESDATPQKKSKRKKKSPALELESGRPAPPGEGAAPGPRGGARETRERAGDTLTEDSCSSAPEGGTRHEVKRKERAAGDRASPPAPVGSSVGSERAEETPRRKKKRHAEGGGGVEPELGEAGKKSKKRRSVAAADAEGGIAGGPAPQGATEDVGCQAVVLKEEVEFEEDLRGPAEVPETPSAARKKKRRAEETGWEMATAGSVSPSAPKRKQQQQHRAGGETQEVATDLSFRAVRDLEPAGETQVSPEHLETPSPTKKKKRRKKARESSQEEAEQETESLRGLSSAAKKKKKKKKKKKRHKAGGENPELESDPGFGSVEDLEPEGEWWALVEYPETPKGGEAHREEEEEEEEEARSESGVSSPPPSRKAKKRQRQRGAGDQRVAPSEGSSPGAPPRVKAEQKSLRGSETPDAGDRAVVLSPSERQESGPDGQGIEPICDDEVQRYIIQLKEFIPNVEKRCPREIIKMGVYDLERFQAFKREGIVLRRGRYSAEENDRLRKNVENFLLLTGIDTATKLFFPARYPNEKTTITKLKNVHKFHKQIADGIPRPWHDIYTRGRKMFDSYNYKGRFTEDDLKALRKYHSMYGNNWTKISELMGRSNHSLEMRFSQMAQNKGVWRKEELRALMRAIGAHMLTQLDPEEAARGQQATIAREKLYKGIPWVEVALKVQTRSWCQCRAKWMSILMKKMSLGEDVYKGSKSYKAKINLIKKLYSLNVEDVADVNWDDLTDTIGDVPPAYVQAKFYKLKVTCVPLWQNKSFGDIIDYLYINTVPKLEDKLMKTEQLAEQNNLNCRKSDYYLLSEILNDDFIEEGDSGDQEV